jgi:hypothetical protein
MTKKYEITYKFGLPLGTLLVIIFVIAKLAGVIAWSWWWVFSPIWLPALILIGIGVIIFLVGLIISIFTK